MFFVLAQFQFFKLFHLLSGASVAQQSVLRLINLQLRGRTQFVPGMVLCGQKAARFTCNTSVTCSYITLGFMSAN